MPITLVPSSSLPTEDEFDHTEFVSVATLFNAFKLSEDAIVQVRSYFRSCQVGWVEKRKESILLAELERKCLGRRDAMTSPIVTKDGWVYWLHSGHHNLMLEALSSLYTNGESDDPDLLLREGIIWQITSVKPNVILCGELYKPTKDDARLFELFTVNRIRF